jgi:hypothetical protein
MRGKNLYWELFCPDPDSGSIWDFSWLRGFPFFLGVQWSENKINTLISLERKGQRVLKKSADCGWKKLRVNDELYKFSKSL